MILGFKPQFNSKIISGEKIHTIRKNKRWKPDTPIQFYNHVRTKKMIKFLDMVCISVQDIKILNSDIFIDDKQIGLGKKAKLALNDGFENYDDFTEWFGNDFEGQIIHWTDFKY